MDILQVGDIVRINELTPEIQHELDTHNYECFDDTTPFVGKHAVVVNVQDEDSGVVGFLICEPEYRFTFDNLSELNRDDVIETVPSNNCAETYETVRANGSQTETRLKAIEWTLNTINELAQESSGKTDTKTEEEVKPETPSNIQDDVKAEEE